MAEIRLKIEIVENWCVNLGQGFEEWDRGWNGWGDGI